MLEKSGHGRTVRYVHLGNFPKHTLLLSALNSAKTIDGLRAISKSCLVGVRSSAAFLDEND
jgi:hypothetical protein